jgi:hypothetical protein
MGALLPAAAASTVSSTAGAAALAKGASLAAGSSLGSGITAGTLLGSGASMASMPALSYAGANLAPALASQGLASTLPGIFANPAAAGFLGKSFATAPGIFAKAAPALGGLPSLATPAASSLSSAALQTAKGNIIQNAMANQATQNAIMQNFATGQGAQNLAAPLTQVGANPAVINSRFGIDMAGVRPGVKMPTELYGGQVTPDMGFKTMGEGASGLIPQTTPATQLASKTASPVISGEDFLTNAMNLIKNPSLQGAKDYVKEHPYATAAAGYGVYSAMQPKYKPPQQDKGTIRPYELEVENLSGEPSDPTSTAERRQLVYNLKALEPYSAANGGIAKAYAIGGPVETMTAMNAVGANTGYPMAGINTPMYSNPMVQRPEAVNVISPSGDAGVTAYSGEPRFAGGGISDLGGYSDGGRLLKGPGDGVSDSIPAVIGNKQPARLADGEFVVPARIVSELGNGSTEAGARKLYAMMERVQNARRKSIGKKKVAVNSKADKHLPA